MLVEILKFFKDKEKKKKFINILSVFLTIFVFFSSLNAYAALDITAGYKGQNDLSSSATGDTGYNAEKSAGTSLLATLNVLTESTIPQVLSTYPTIQANASLPPLAKVGLAGAADNMVMSMLNNYSGVDVPKYLASEWVPGYSSDTSIYAASDGYSYLQEAGVDTLWDRIRLISYIFFVVILIVAGFMIMFRQKIGGQLAVSVFNTLPNVIIALILVTFSFAIVGLLLNFGVMLINVLTSVLGINAANALKVDSPFSLLNLFKGTQIPGATTTITVPIIVAIITGALALFAGTGGLALGALVAVTVVAALFALLVAGIVIYASIRVYITILSAYLNIILNTILAPVYLTFSAFPGQQGMVTDWLNRILKGVLTFPIVFFFINLGAFILNGNLNLGFPSGFMTGDFTQLNTDTTPIGWLIKGVLVVVLFFYAADAPKVLDDFLPVNSGKGAMGALEGAKKGMSRIPLIGSFFG